MKLIGWVEWAHHDVVREVIELWTADAEAERRAGALLEAAHEIAGECLPESKTKQSIRVRARYSGLRVDFDPTDGGFRAVFRGHRD